MLNSVPTQINKMARSVTLRHPNAIDVTVFRKSLERTATTSTGGIPDIGGLAVLDSEDESEVDWGEVGDGRMLRCQPFERSNTVNRGDSLDQSSPDYFVTIESLIAPGETGYFVPKKHDVVYVFMGQDVKIAYEIVDVKGDVDVSPYTRAYLLQKRDDLTYIGSFPD